MSEATPRGVYPSLWDWVGTSRAGRFRDHEMQNVMYMEDTLSLSRPKGVEPPAHPGFQKQSVTIPKAFVAVLPQGRYWVAENRMAAIIAPDNKIILDMSMQYSRPNSVHPVYKKHELPQAKATTETVAVVNFIWDNNYYHWLGEVLARIHLLDKSGIRIDKYIINGNGSTRFQKETLAMLDIPEHRIVRSEAGMHLKPKRLIVPSFETYRLKPFQPHSMPRWASGYLRTALSNRIGSSTETGYRRIYVSREYAQVRKVTNEEQVCRLLSGYGFHKVLLESLTVAEQIRLFASADTIVAPHGAGLANLLFCRPGTKVLELYAPNYVNTVYWYLSNHFGLDYYYLFGEGERLPVHSGVGDVERRTDDITVDLQALGELVANMLTEGSG
ncbi:glycosyltransferase family 61 protein [Paenibacillus mesophilus]|uniref:glycosyltransferase family 61 protein n=1 Tax=Paenibacillus mesophilus TaxID=2582849 RepID=UPI00110D75EA|nr:glycosyltransferase family 61 protein [Paenibacillus mesophilus]TMV53007.1 glycosyltransferase family 61 protein [Paenibacillus mesophilus]